MRQIQTPNAPSPAGHYSQAILHEEQLFISGQLPIDASQKDQIAAAKAPFRDQVRRALENVLAILAAAGGLPKDLIKVTVYIVGVENWPILNDEYAKVLGEARPARSVVPVPALHHGFLVEIDAIAAGMPYL